MKQKLFPLIIAGMLVAGAASAQQPVAPPPDDLTLEKSRASMLETQLLYFVNVLRRSEAQLAQEKAEATANMANPQATADWWAAYAAAIKQAEDKKQK